MPVKRLRALDAELPVIVLTAYGTIETAVEAMKLGAFDFILKPFDVEAVGAAVRNAAAVPAATRTENRYLRDATTQPAGLEDLDRRVACDAGGLRAHPARGADQERDADHGRDRHGQRARGARDPQL